MGATLATKRGLTSYICSMAEEMVRFQQIPEAQLPAFVELFTLEDAQFNELSEALRAAPAKVKVSAVVKHLSKKVKSIPAEKVSALIMSLKTLLGAMEGYHVSAMQASRDIVRSALKQAEKELRAEDSDKYETRLLSLLQNPNLILSSKALSLLNDHARTFGTLRIISDVRPVFGEDTNVAPHGWMLYHTMHFRCNLTKEVEDDIYIALDTADLREIERLVQRATAKQDILIKQLRKAKLAYITPDEVEA